MPCLTEATLPLEQIEWLSMLHKLLNHPKLCPETSCVSKSAIPAVESLQRACPMFLSLSSRPKKLAKAPASVWRPFTALSASTKDGFQCRAPLELGLPLKFTCLPPKPSR